MIYTSRGHLGEKFYIRLSSVLKTLSEHLSEREREREREIVKDSYHRSRCMHLMEPGPMPM